MACKSEEMTLTLKNNVNKSNPPILEDNSLYESWRKDISLWRAITSEDKKKQGVLIYFALKGKARDACRDLSEAVLTSDTGYEKVLEKLDSLFLMDKNRRAFLAYQEFRKFTRPDNMTISDFLLVFDSKYFKFTEHGMTLPDAVLAFELLDSAKISEADFRLAMTSIDDVTFENMRLTLKKIFTNELPLCSGLTISDTRTVKLENTLGEGTDDPVLYGSDGGRQPFRPDKSRFGRQRPGYSNRSGRRFSRGGGPPRMRGSQGRRLNPPGPDGEPSVCLICNSKFHWARNCPDSYESRDNQIDDKDIDSIHLVYYASNNVNKNTNNNFSVETANCAVLDTGCASKNVCGEKWLEGYLEYIGRELGSLKKEPGKNKFRFGGGDVFCSNEFVHVPCVFGGKNIYFKCNVVKCNIPLLISKAAMKKMEMIIDTKNDTVRFFDAVFPLKVTTSGHYYLPLMRPVDNMSVDDVLYSSDNYTVNRMAIKLHKQFAHPSSEKLIKLVKKSTYCSEDLLEEIKKVTDDCEICTRYRKAPPRPAVSLPLAYHFNDTVAMDLKYWDRGWYFLVLVDLATRFCSACVIRDKKPDTIIKAIFKYWITIFGTPKRFLSDNGCEFNNETMRNMGENFNISVLCTAAESPWSNGVCERLNGVLACNVRKILTDCGCSLDVALSWAVSARNSMDNNCGFSPSQLVFGQNPTLPGLNDKLPALEARPMIGIVSENLHALYCAREEFIRNDSDQRIKRALLRQVRPSNFDTIVNGAQVFYKRINDEAWHGPGVVIGRDGKQILVRHGGTWVRAHICRVVVGHEDAPKEDKVDDTSCGADVGDNRNFSGVQRAAVLAEGFGNTDNDEMQDTPSSPPSDVREVVLPSTPSSDDAEIALDSSSSSSSSSTSTTSRDGGLGCVSPPSSGAAVVASDSVTPLRGGVSPHIASCISLLNHASSGDVRVKDSGYVSQSLKNKRIQYENSHTGEIVTGRVLSRAGKASGKYSNAWNVKNDNDGESACVDLDRDVNNWKEIDDSDEVLILFDSNEVFQAKSKEIENWKNNDVYVEVSDVGQKALSVRWVITEKIKDGNPIVKARLVARGFEENTENLAKYSPTCNKESFRLVLAIIAAKNWYCHTIDIKAAFLQGYKIERDVFVRPPKEFYNGSLWKLNKTVYGLNDAARAWYLRVKGELLKLGLNVCKLDQAVFYWYDSGCLSGVICLHVDDFCWAGNSAFQEKVIEKIYHLFLVGSASSESNFKYVGLQVTQSDKSIKVDQVKYVSSIEKVKIKDEKEKERILTDDEKRNFRVLVGQLNWVATQTRPDILFDVSVLSSKCNNARVADCVSINKVLKNVSSTDVEVIFRKNLNIEKLSLLGYSDASFANLGDSGSQSGFLIFVTDGTIQCPILWQSRRIKRVVRSTLAAETMALIECVEACIYLAHIINEILWNNNRQIGIHCLVDNKSLTDSIMSQKLTDDRHLRINMAALNDLITRENVKVRWIPSPNQLANPLTKAGASGREMIRSIM